MNFIKLTTEACELAVRITHLRAYDWKNQRLARLETLAHKRSHRRLNKHYRELYEEDVRKAESNWL